MEDMWKRNDVDTHLSQRSSFSARTQQRLHQSFETVEEARKRQEKTPPNSRIRSHCPSKIEGDLEKLMEDVPSWQPEPINWSEKAREYNIKGENCSPNPPNAGQLLKEYLRSEGVNIEIFEQPGKGM